MCWKRESISHFVDRVERYKLCCTARERPSEVTALIHLAKNVKRHTHRASHRKIWNCFSFVINCFSEERETLCASAKSQAKPFCGLLKHQDLNMVMMIFKYILLSE